MNTKSILEELEEIREAEENCPHTDKDHDICMDCGKTFYDKEYLDECK